MSYQTWKSYTKIVPYTRQEREEADAAERAQREEIEAEKSEMLLSWTASNGKEVCIFSDEKNSFLVQVGTSYYGGQYMQSVSAEWQAKGIVAKLGSVGLTAERKAILESK